MNSISRLRVLHRLPLAVVMAAAIPTAFAEVPPPATSSVSPAVATVPAPTGKVKKLGAVVVNGRFVSNAGISAMKLDVPVIDTPYSLPGHAQDEIAPELARLGKLKPRGGKAAP